ncbi:853_t:CDS:2, partial [Cetraspora pellucida]
EEVYSDKSSSNAALLFSKKYNEGKKTAYPGPEIFGLQIECVEKERLKKQHSRTLKSIDNLSLSAQRDRANKVARLEYQTFEEKYKTLYHPNDNPILRSISNK